MTDYKATPEQWAQCEEFLSNPVVGASDACILELRARVEVLEDAAQKHIIETSANILALASRVEALEASQQQPEPIDQEENDRRFHACMNLIKNATPEQIRAAAGLPERPASKVYEINKPLRLTPDQVQQVLDQLRPKSTPTPSPSQIRSSPDHFGQVNKMVGGSLVERVYDAMVIAAAGNEARAAIREVAAWMTSNPDVYFPPALVFALEREAGR